MQSCSRAILVGFKVEHSLLSWIELSHMNDDSLLHTSDFKDTCRAALRVNAEGAVASYLTCLGPFDCAGN